MPLNVVEASPLNRIELVEELETNHELSQGMMTQTTSIIQQLRREIPLPVITLSNGSAGAQLYFTELANFQPFKDILLHYSYFRAKGMRLRLVMTSLPFQYGLIQVNYFPAYDVTKEIDLKNAISLRHDILRISAQDSLEVELPFIYPSDRMPVEMLYEYIGRMWAISIVGFMGATIKIDTAQTGGTTTVKLRPYISWVDPELSFPQPIEAYSPWGAIVAEEKEKDPFYMIESQADARSFVSSIGAAAMGTGLLEGANTAYKYYSQGKEVVGKAKEVYATSQEVAEEIKQTLGLGEECEIKTDTPMGTDSITEDQVQFNLYGDAGYCNQSTGRSIADRKLPLVMGACLGDSRRLHRLIDIMRENPDFVGFYRMADNALEQTLSRPNPLQDFGYTGYFAQFFKYWRGSMELRFVCTTSAFVACKLCVQVGFNSNVGPISHVGLNPTIIKTIKGSTEFVVQVPFMYPIQRNDTMQDDAAGSKWLRPLIVAWQVFDMLPADQFLHVAVYKRPGPDFMYELTQAAVYATPGELIVTSQTSNAAFEKPDIFPTFSPAPSIAWDMPIEQLLSKWSARLDYDTFGPIYVSTRVERPVSPTPIIVANWDLLTRCFLWNSGDISQKIVTKSGSGPMSVSYYNFSGNQLLPECEPADGQAVTDSSLWPVLDFEQPFYYSLTVDANPYTVFDFFSTTYQANPTLFRKDNSAVLTSVWLRAGKTFQVHRLIPLLNKTAWPINSAVIG
jgi:hypothetical protein